MGITVSQTLLGFSLENLDPEKLSISLIVFQLGRSRTDALERLVSKVWRALVALPKDDAGTRGTGWLLCCLHDGMR